jgi:hypothetical protein
MEACVEINLLDFLEEAVLRCGNFAVDFYFFPPFSSWCEVEGWSFGCGTGIGWNFFTVVSASRWN